MTTMAVKVVFHPMLLNILDMLVVLKLKLLILTLPKMEHVFIDHQSQSHTFVTEASISLKAMKKNLLKDSTMLGQSQFPSKLLLDSKIMLEEFIQLIIVERLPGMSIMQYWQLDLGLKKERSFGILKTLGEQPGEPADILKFKEM